MKYHQWGLYRDLPHGFLARKRGLSTYLLRTLILVVFWLRTQQMWGVFLFKPKSPSFLITYSEHFLEKNSRGFSNIARWIQKNNNWIRLSFLSYGGNRVNVNVAIFILNKKSHPNFCLTVYQWYYSCWIPLQQIQTFIIVMISCRVDL